MPISYVQPVIDYSVRELCTKPYPNHKKGCPNFGKRQVCPPQAKQIEEFFLFDRRIMAVYIAFDLSLHREKMLVKHPDWTRRQLDCCLYWQQGVNARLRHWTEFQLLRPILWGKDKPPLVATYCPEAMGVNVTETMKQAGVELEWPPERLVWKVSLVGVPSSYVRG